MVRTLLAILLLATPAVAAPTQAELVKARAEAAAKIYPVVLANFAAGRGTVEDVYRWSVRWLDGEVERTKGKAPLADHAKRMAELETKAKAARDAGTIPSTDFEIAAYFHVEADLWVLRGKAH